MQAEGEVRAGEADVVKLRRHHNNKGTRQVKRGRTVDQVKRIARKLRVPFVAKPSL